ncbi:MAG TPA: glycoside hydrolase family 2 TIM barrel-domain containing protein [Bacteroidales bacterium]|nr:glycoside hydrolase family 2 TIM barrel-domain containing protein [Bacteroidales bacterium]
MKQLSVIIFAVAALLIQSCSNQPKESVNRTDEKQQLRNWKMESSTQVPEREGVISSKSFNDTAWVNAIVPTTVLKALVNAGIYPDPHFDLNDLKIPDASDELSKRLDLNRYSHLKNIPNPFKDPYWFRTTFTIPQKNKGKTVWLNFDGINYRADVWLNGRQIADSGEMAGMFRRFKYDVTDFIDQNGENVLAVKIYQVDHVGTPNPGFQFNVFGPQRGSGADIFKDVTLKFSAGWDCAPVVRDRNMGIYQDVYLNYTGDVDIEDPYIVTDLALPDTTRADITVTAVLKNNGNTAKKGVLKGKIDLIKEVDFQTYRKVMPGNLKTIAFEKEVEVDAGKNITVSFSPTEFTQLCVKNPYLWWPNGYGKQYLHNLNLTFETDGKISDVHNTTFGIREISCTFKELDGETGRIFWVNGQKIFCRGGWIQPEMMLDMNEKRINSEVRFLAEANVNMIACEDMPSPPDHVMDIYDKYGLLMWETFYQCWTSYPGTPSFANPLDTKMSLKNSFDIVRRYRNHPSLVLWAGACETLMREELYVPLREYIREMDPSRPFLATSSYDWDVDSLTPYMKPDLPTGMTDDGPPDYTWYPHPYYYNKVLEVKKQMFRDELGVPAVSTMASMKKYIFDLGQGEKNDIYPLDKKWAYHDAWDGNGYAFRAYDRAIRDQYGQPSTVEEYIRHAQYVNAGSYRAMFEAANHRMWDITSGVMLWKLNATWPQVLWQIYDWFLNPNSAYYYTKKALEPVHIQLNENDFTVSVINTLHKKHNNLSANVRVLNSDMKVKWEKDEEFDIKEDCYKELFKIPAMEGLTSAYFVKLLLKDANGNIVSDNFYWFSSVKDRVDLSEISGMPKVRLEIYQNLTWENDEGVMEVKVKNPSDKLAFFNRLLITKGEGGEEVLPTFWTDNFFSLLPGEVKIVTARFSKQDLEGKKPVLVIDKDI